MIQVIITENDTVASTEFTIKYKVVDDAASTIPALASPREWFVVPVYSFDFGQSWHSLNIVSGDIKVNSAFTEALAPENTLILDTSEIRAVDFMVRLMLNFVNNVSTQIEVGSGLITDYDLILPDKPIIKNTVRITTRLNVPPLTTVLLEDDGNGNLVENPATATGSSGTINYNTGYVTLSYGSVVGSGEVITAVYDTPVPEIPIAEEIGPGDGNRKVFFHKSNYMMLRNSIKILRGTSYAAASLVGVDNGDGYLENNNPTTIIKSGEVEYLRGYMRLVYFDIISSTIYSYVDFDTMIDATTSDSITIDNVTSNAWTVKQMPPILIQLDPDKVAEYFYKILELERVKQSTIIASIADLFDPYNCPEVLLIYLADAIGLHLDTAFPVDNQRRQIAGAMDWYREKGRRSAFEIFFAQRGWTCIITELWSNGYTILDYRASAAFFKLPRVDITLLKYDLTTPIGVNDINRLFNLLYEVLPIHVRLRNFVTGYDLWDMAHDIKDIWDTDPPAIAAIPFDPADITWIAPGAYSTGNPVRFYLSFPKQIRDGTSFLVRGIKPFMEKLREGDGVTNPAINFTLQELPVEPGSVSITYVDTGSVTRYLQDDNTLNSLTGNLMFGMLNFGTINYETGVISLPGGLPTIAGAGEDVLCYYEPRRKHFEEIIGVGNGVTTSYPYAVALATAPYMPSSFEITTQVWGASARVVDDGMGQLFYFGKVHDTDSTVIATDTAGAPPPSPVNANLLPVPIPQKAPTGYATIILQFVNATTNAVVIETTTDNGAGNILAATYITGGTINYATGAISITHAAIPAVVAGTLTFTVTIPVVYQHKNNIQVGTIDYATGNITLTFPDPPDNGINIDLKYCVVNAILETFNNRNPWSDEEWVRGCYVPIDFKSGNLVYRMGTWINRFGGAPGGWNNADVLTVT